jgi:glycosyltransferase involved in cell wall biosynthesis
MMNQSLISIIIPTYNRAHLISETLDSISAQTYTNWECIIVDDGSTDNTKEIINNYIQEDNRFQYHQRPCKKQKGANACRNYGFEMSKGEYINWFDSDDLMLPNKLESQVKKLSISTLDFIICQTLVFENEKENILGLRKEKIYSEDFFNDFITNEIKWLTQAPLIKRGFIVNNKLMFDENLMQSQEKDFFIKMLNIVDDYLYDYEPLVLFRNHNNSISNNKDTIEKLTSNFQVNYRILRVYKDKISKQTKYKTIKGLKQILLKIMKLKNKRFENECYVKIYNEIPEFNKRIKFLIGYYLIKYTKKGYVLYK